jgi:hypothetical protein
VAARRARLGQQSPRHAEVEHAQRGEHDEDGAPAERACQQAAHQRREAGAYHRHQAHQREAAHGVVGLGRVAHDRAPQQQAGAAARGLYQPRPDQHAHVGREHRHQATHGVQRQPHQQGRPAPEHVRQRAVDELSDRQPEDVDADRHPDGGRVHPQVVAGDRERGHEHVHRQRPAEGDQHQQPQGRGALDEREGGGDRVHGRAREAVGADDLGGISMAVGGFSSKRGVPASRCD